MPLTSFVLEGSVWEVSTLTCGYLATCAELRLLVVGETVDELIAAACDSLGIPRVSLTEAITKVEW